MEALLFIAGAVYIGYLLLKGKNTPTPPYTNTSKIDDNTFKTYSITKPEPEFTLSDQQKDFFEQVENSTDHYFVTGKAGTGKSYLLQYLKLKSKKKIVVVAPTGVAAINVGGQTIHSLFKLPPSVINLESVRVGLKTKELLSHVETIVIDEVSMVRVDLMDAIDSVMRQSRDPSKPFGGSQIIMFGDPYQLPPVVSDREIERYFNDNFGGVYFFNARVWENTSFITLELDKIYRQNDNDLIDILNSVRVNEISEDVLNRLNIRLNTDDDSEALTLATTNNRVMQINNQHLAKIDLQSYWYHAQITGELDKKSFPAEEHLELKVGAQVMMLKNDKQRRWVNGTVGKISALTINQITVNIGGINFPVSKETWSRIEYQYNQEQKHIEEKVISQFMQFPVRLAWAVTIHKSQGQTYDNVKIDLENGAFAHGQTYVALSRCRTLDGITLVRSVETRDIIVDPKIRSFMERLV